MYKPENCLQTFLKNVLLLGLVGFYESRDLKLIFKPDIMVHAFSLRIWEAETGESLSFRPTLSQEQVPGQASLVTQRSPVLKNKSSNKTGF